MRRVVTLVFPLCMLLLNGCAEITPVKNLALPPVRIIEGKVTKVDKSGFTLADDSGSIYVRAELPDDKSLGLVCDEKIRVYGNLQGGRERQFDGYVIRRASGEQIIISNPTPHFGFVIQSGFK